MSKLVIIGSGFAGCTAVRTLRKQGYRDAITVVSPHRHLFYYPSLVWVPAGQRSEADLQVDLTEFFRRHDVVHQSATVTGLDPRARLLRTDQGEVGYDYLVIASGGRYLQKLPGIEHAHVACAGWEPTQAFSERLAAMDGGRLAFGFAGNPKEPAAMRGGPVFEFMFGVDTLLRQQRRRDKFEITFVSPAPRPGARLGERAVKGLLNEMSRRGIQTHLGNKMKAITPDKVVTEGGEVASDLTLFVPGMTGPAWAPDSGLPLSEGGFLQADAQCRAAGEDGPVERVYVAGDAGTFPGPDWKPKQAHMADLQAEAAVKNLLAHAAGRPEVHTFKTELICIVDSLNTGILVYRGANRTFQLGGPPFHWAKTLFEWSYLRPYRRAA